MNGRSTRSLNGCCSSISSRLFGRWLKAARRSAMTSFPVLGRYRPATSSAMPAMARRANSMDFLNLDCDELANGERAHDDADERSTRQGQPWTGCEQRPHIGGRDQHQQTTDRHGHARQDIAGHAALGRHGADFALQLYALTNGAGDRVENARQVA